MENFESAINEKSKKSSSTAKRKRNQRKKQTSSIAKDKTGNEPNRDSSKDSAKTKNHLELVHKSYPSYVIKKRIGCTRLGPHRKKKPKPKIQPKLTVVISKVGGQIIAKKKEDNSIKPDTSPALRCINLGRKSLEVSRRHFIIYKKSIYNLVVQN